MNQTEAIYTLVGSGVTAVGAVGVAWVKSRGSVRTAEIGAEAQEDSLHVTAYHQLVADLQSDVARLRQDHDDLRDEHASLRVDYDELNRHVITLEIQSTQDKSLIRHLILYIRLLRDEIRRIGGDVPEAPADLEAQIREPGL